MKFDWNCLSSDHQGIMRVYVGTVKRPADRIICGPDGEPFLYRWHVVPKNKRANVFFEVLTRSDPNPHFHDAPWGFRTQVLARSVWFETHRAGTAFRTEDKCYAGSGFSSLSPHRLGLAVSDPALLLTLTGPRERDWGFYVDGVFVPHDKYLQQQKETADVKG